MSDFNIKLGNESITVVKQTKYVGTYIVKESNDENINQACKDLVSQCYMIISQFGFCSPDIRKSLFISLFMDRLLGVYQIQNFNSWSDVKGIALDLF